MIDSRSIYLFTLVSLLQQSSSWALYYKKCLIETQPTHTILVKILRLYILQNILPEAHGSDQLCLLLPCHFLFAPLEIIYIFAYHPCKNTSFSIQGLTRVQSF